MQESNHIPTPVTKPRRYVLVFGEIQGRNGDDEYVHDWTLTVYPQNEVRRVKGGYSDAIIIRLDDEDHENLENFSKKIRFTDDDKYPFYRENNRTITILEYLYGYDPKKYLYLFKNNDEYDLKRDNVTICPLEHSELIEKHNVIEYIPGHSKAIGQHANKMKNPLWKIKEENNEYLMMYCETDTICKLCPVSYQKILDFEKDKNDDKKLTFFKNATGYILTHIGTSGLYIHQIITGCFGNGKGTSTISVDHIDQDPLNNSYDNLRVVSQEVQRANQTGIKEGTKRARNKNAQPFPEGITHDMLIKYVSPRTEAYGTTGKTRTYFVVEGHPVLTALGKRYLYSSKSEKVSNEEKLAQAISIVESLDAGTYQEKEPALPKYYSLSNARGKPHLVYERRREDGTRMNVKMVLPEDFDMSSQVERLAAKVSVKYPDVVVEAK